MWTVGGGGISIKLFLGWYLHYQVNGSIMWPGEYHIMSICFWKLKLLPKFMQWRNATSFSKSYFVLWRIAKELTLILSILCEDTTKSFWFPFLKYVVLLVQNFNTINSSRSNQDKNRFFFEEKKVKFGLSCLDTLFLKWYQCTKYYIENDLTRPPPTKSWKLHLRRETELR